MQSQCPIKAGQVLRLLFVFAALLLWSGASLAQNGEEIYYAKPGDMSLIHQANEIYETILKTRSVSDADLAKLCAIADKSGQNPYVVGEAIKTMMWLKRDRVPQEQKEKIKSLLIRLKLRYNEVTDPKEIIKNYGWSVEERLFPGSHLFVLTSFPAVQEKLPVRLREIMDSVRKTKSLSPDDLDHLLAKAQITPPHLASRYLTPLLFIEPGSLTAAQQERIFEELNQFMLADDLPADPEGEIKMACNTIVRNILTDDRYRTALSQQMSDSRKYVRASAEEALAAIRSAK